MNRRTKHRLLGEDEEWKCEEKYNNGHINVEYINTGREGVLV
jgi:hypothetical protein